jgi:hypothetical protein
LTIAIAVQVHDGIVFASDSASTISIGDGNIVNVYNNANKIFNLRKGLPIGGMTYGMGSIGVSSIATLAKDLRRRFMGEDPAHEEWKIDPSHYSIEDVAKRSRDFLFTECYVPLNVPAKPGVQFGFQVGGYSSDAKTSELWQIVIADGDCQEPTRLIAQDEVKVQAAGEPEAFSRLVLGFSQKLAAALIKMGLAEADVPSAIEQIQQELHEPLLEAPMPIQDAIDLAEFLVHTTTMYTRFKHGAATVGGPIESAVITKHEGFKWVRRKHYFDTRLNPMERNHEAEH